MTTDATRPREGIAFAGFVLESSTGTLWRAGRAHSLRPKTQNVLEAFLARPNVVLTKEHLLTTVWADTVVTDDSLTQCIGELRRALGEENRDLIRTIPKRGFILNAAPEPFTASAKKGAPTRIFGTAIGVISALALLILWSPWTASRQAKPQRDIVAVSTIAVQSPDSAVSAQLLQEALQIRLEEIPTLGVRDFDQLLDATTIPSQLQNARANGIDWLLSGQINVLLGGKADRLRLWLWETGSATRYSLGVFSLPADLTRNSTAGFVALRDEIVQRALERIPGHVIGAQEAHGFPEQVKDFERYAFVMAELEKERCNLELSDAIEPVVDNTPDFARGWMAKAWTHWVNYWACGLDASVLQEAELAADRVLALWPNYPQAIKVKTSVMAALGNVRGAIAVVDNATLESPNAAALWSTTSYLLNYSGDLRRSEAAMDRALAVDPLVLVAETGETPNVYLYINNWTRFLEHQPPFDSPYFNFQRAYALFRSGDHIAARRITLDTRRRFPSDLYARFGAALQNVIDGHPAAAGVILNGIIEERDSGGQRDGEVAYREAIMLMIAGDTTRAIERLEVAVAQDFDCVECVLIDPIWEPALQDVRVAQWIAERDEGNDVR